MKKINIVADSKIPYLKGALEEVARIEYYDPAEINRDLVNNADALIIRTRTKCNKDLLEGSSVKFITTATIGYDHIDTGYCRERGIAWTNAPGCNSSSVEQYIVSALLSLSLKHKISLKQMVLGVVGVGNVGRKVAHAAEILGMKVILNDPPRERSEGKAGFSSLNTLIEQSDIISFHVPLNISGPDKTLHLADESFFKKIKKDLILINSSRGKVVDEKALLKFANTGLLKDLVLDVWEHEPVIKSEVLDLCGLATPHIAGYSVDGKANGTMMSVRAIASFFDIDRKDWSPNALPGGDPVLSPITFAGLYEYLAHFYFQTYDIRSDDAKLRENPDSFEHLRGNYGIRREPSYYSIKEGSAQKEVTEILQDLGFKIS